MNFAENVAVQSRVKPKDNFYWFLLDNKKYTFVQGVNNQSVKSLLALTRTCRKRQNSPVCFLLCIVGMALWSKNCILKKTFRDQKAALESLCVGQK